jgi:protein-tyrosine phosphatase
MKTEVIDIKKLSDIQSAVEYAQSVLEKGGLVAFPTETVYGLAVNADLPEAVASLRKIKDRPDEKPFTLHIGSKTFLHKYVPGISLLNMQFLRRAWPGPLTAVFSLNPDQLAKISQDHTPPRIQALYHNNSIGIRLPDDRTAQALLSTFSSPVVAPSANLAGQVPPTSGDDVLEQLDGKIDLLLDSGPTRYSQASTIVKLSGEDMQIIRPGVLDADSLDRMRSLNILFVCTGNTCRSPMAEGICRYYLAKKLSCSVDQLDARRYKINSAGTMSFNGSPATPEAIQACQEIGVDVSGHRARILTIDLVNQADYIFVMESYHSQTVLNLDPQAEAKTSLLGGREQVSDPIGMSVDGYRKSVQAIKQYVTERLDELFKL